MVGECMGELLINHEAVDFPEKLLRVTISSEKSSGVWRASVTMATQFLLLPPVTETSKTRHNTQSTQSLISKWKGNYVVPWLANRYEMSSDVKLDIIGHISGSRPRDWGRQMDGRHHFVQGGICSEMEGKKQICSEMQRKHGHAECF